MKKVYVAPQVEDVKLDALMYSPNAGMTIAASPVNNQEGF